MSSATGGPLLSPLPDEVALRRFFQGLIVGITGLPGQSVLPRWQPNPPPMPAIEEDWVSFDIRERTPDANAYVVAGATDEDGSTQLRHETFTLACSFFGPAGAGYAERLRDGLELGQNREPLLLAAMGYLSSAQTLFVPELHNQQWYSRHDLDLRFSRQLNKRYDILCFTGVVGAIITETLSLPFEANIP